MADNPIFMDRREARVACDAANAARTRDQFLAGRFFLLEKHGFILKFTGDVEVPASCTLNAEIAAFVTRKVA